MKHGCGIPRAQLIWIRDWSEHDISVLLLHLNKLPDELHCLVTFGVEDVANHPRFDRFLKAGKLEETLIDCLLDYPPQSCLHIVHKFFGYGYQLVNWTLNFSLKC